MSDYYEEDDVPRYTLGLLEAEQRLTAFAEADAPIVDEAAHSQLADDIRLVLRELNGLKQFDPR